ncbi:MAG TPA: PAS domain S-box protein, partial [Opitutaceae bacterium]|nr:PAS domain S-box protein [Opitutaceae bacterium]
MKASPTENDQGRTKTNERTVIDTAPALIHTGLPDGSLDFFNQRWLEYFGVRLEEIQGWRWTTVIHPEDVEGMVATWRAALASGEPFEAEARVRRADGQYRWFLHRKVPMRDERGAIVKWYGSSVDIEDLKQKEDALRRSEAYLAEAQRLSHTGSFGWSVSSGEIFWSEETFRIFEYDPSAKPTLELVLGRVHPEDKAVVRQLIERVSRDGKDFDAAHRLLMPDGAIKHLHVVAHGAGDESGNLEFVGSVMDVTERKRGEEALRKSEEQWRDVFENNPTMYFMVDAAGTVMSVNPFGAEQLGYSVSELVGQPVLTVFYEPDRPKVQEN